MIYVSLSTLVQATMRRNPTVLIAMLGNSESRNHTVLFWCPASPAGIKVSHKLSVEVWGSLDSQGTKRIVSVTPHWQNTLRGSVPVPHSGVFEIVANNRATLHRPVEALLSAQASSRP